MRITNRMTSNNLLLGLNRNSQRLNKLQMQIATGQKIQKASEDPITAALALKLRTNVSETIQYEKNAKQASSWMQASEAAVTNTNKILDRIKELCQQASNETTILEDRKNIMEEVSQLSQQLINESNVTYGGRYVLGGFKTDQELLFSKDIPNDTYIIQQPLNKDNIETIKATAPPVAGDIVNQLKEVDRIKLPYTDSATPTFTPNIGAVTQTNSSDPNAYVVGDNEIKYLEDTGEIILGKNASQKLKDEGDFTVTYEKEGFKKGDLNPQQYFNCTQTRKDDNILTPPKTYTKSADDIEYGVGSRNSIKVNIEGSEVFTPELIGDLNDLMSLVNRTELRSEQQIKDDLRLAIGDTAYNALTSEELKKKVADIQKEETKVFTSIVTSRFDSVMGKTLKHIDKVSSVQSEIGGRMNRLELIESRLGDDKVNFKQFMTENEGVEYEDAYTEYVMQKTIYDSALSVGAKIMQQTLVDYLR